MERGVNLAIRYLALGDSYTIGTGASNDAHNFPSILAGLLSKATRKQVALANPAVNGYTTLDLIAKELNYLDGKPDVVPRPFVLRTRIAEPDYHLDGQPDGQLGGQCHRIVYFFLSSFGGTNRMSPLWRATARMAPEAV